MKSLPEFCDDREDDSSVLIDVVELILVGG